MGVNIVTSPESSEEMMNYAMKDISSQSSNYLATTACVTESSTQVEENDQREERAVSGQNKMPLRNMGKSLVLESSGMQITQLYANILTLIEYFIYILSIAVSEMWLLITVIQGALFLLVKHIKGKSKNVY